MLHNLPNFYNETNKHLILIVIILFLGSCGKNNTVKSIDNNIVLAQSLTNNDFSKVQETIPLLRLTENAQNLIQLYTSLHIQSLASLKKQVHYNQQFIRQMNSAQQAMLGEVMKWAYIKQIYRQEISPPVRILQRQKLYLAPSHIDFNKCLNGGEGCASEARHEIASLLSNDDIRNTLIKMAEKDPCANLSLSLEDDVIANKCLKFSKGSLQLDLLEKPKFTNEEWLSVINNE